MSEDRQREAPGLDGVRCLSARWSEMPECGGEAGRFDLQVSIEKNHSVYVLVCLCIITRERVSRVCVHVYAYFCICVAVLLNGTKHPHFISSF